MLIDPNTELETLTATQSELGRAIGLSHQRINQLINEGIVVRDPSRLDGRIMLLDSIRNFYLSRNRNLGGEAPVNFWHERGLHEKANRELAEIKLRKSRGEVYDASTVENVLSEILTNFRNRMLGLPSKYAAQLHGKNRAEIKSILTEAIAENLDDLVAGLEAASFVDDDVAGTDS